MKCLILSLSDRHSIYSITFPVLEKYCIKNNYHYKFLYESLDNNRNIAWSKIIFLLLELTYNYNKYDYYIWVDDDILFTDHETKICDIINKYDFDNILVSKDVVDWCPINSGIIICKNSDKTRDILKSIYKLGEITGTINRHNWEQNAIILYYNQFMKSSKEIVCIPHNVIQSFYRDYDITQENIWKPGHFSAHVTGMPEHKRIAIFNSILGQ